jgi:imidazole glycerol-phosphate synthase subunit HisH
MSETPEIVVVDFQMGNLFSVSQALTRAGARPQVSGDPITVAEAGAIVLPGVGAMPDAMRALDASGLSGALRHAAAKGTPLLGICLGMQLLMSHGSEFEEHDGLGIVPGRVLRFPDRDAAGARVRVPHIGWNAVEPTRDANELRGTPLEPIGAGADMYFVHSYYVEPADPSVVRAQTEYAGIRFCSVLASGEIWGMQFHPERSGDCGLGIYEGFVRRVTSRRGSFA